jgi:hypothetical protein
VRVCVCGGGGGGLSEIRMGPPEHK